MFVLILNDMRSSQIEIVNPRFRAETKRELEAFLESEEVEKYTTDNRWAKSYRQGGPLEWYNHPFSMDEYIVDVGTEESWAANARANYSAQIMNLPTVPQ